jgi:hypothetical protein
MTDTKDNMPMLTHHAMGFEKPKKPLDLEDEEEVPRPEPMPVTIDPFIEEIAKIKHSQSPAVRDTIERAPCFGRNWYIDHALTAGEDLDEGGICDQWDCDLRSLCELVYTRSTGKEIEQQKNDDPVSYQDTQEIPPQGKSKKKIKPKIRKYTRFPYVDQGRPIDKMATLIWELLGGPPSLPDSWMFPSVKTKQDLDLAPHQFRDRFGPGIMVSRRTNYHQFFKEGSHFLRLWMTAPGGGWMDISGSLAKVILKIATDLKLEHPPQKMLRKRYRFYPYRTFIHRKAHLNRLAEVFEHLGIVPMADQKQQENENEDQGV